MKIISVIITVLGITFCSLHCFAKPFSTNEKMPPDSIIVEYVGFQIKSIPVLVFINSVNVTHVKRFENRKFEVQELDSVKYAELYTNLGQIFTNVKLHLKCEDNTSEPSKSHIITLTKGKNKRIFYLNSSSCSNAFAMEIEQYLFENKKAERLFLDTIANAISSH